MTIHEHDDVMTVTCDMCGGEITTHRHAKATTITCETTLFDYRGDEASRAKTIFDVCDECEEIMAETIASLMKEASYGSNA